MNTRFGASLALIVAALVSLGLALGNPPLLYTAIGPIAVLLLGLAARPPGTLSIIRTAPTQAMWVRGIMEVQWEVRLGYGPCAIMLFDPLPEEFALVEGNNLRLLSKGFRPATFTCTYKVRCTKRGAFPLSNTQWNLRDLLSLFQPREGEVDNSQEIAVRPRILRTRRLQPLRTRAATRHPEADIARLGMPTTEFQELRHYSVGDPLRLINWKATARTAGSPGALPLVNEYEPEGRKAVWLFVNASHEMEVGTSIENALEWAVEAASGVSYYFLQRGYRMGGCIYNTETQEPHILYSDTGKRQYFVLARELTELRPGAEAGNLQEAVERSKVHLLRHKPLSIIITRLDSFPERSLIQGVRRLVQFSSRRGRSRPSVLVIGINGYFVAPEVGELHGEAIAITRTRTRGVVRWLNRVGVRVMEWNPLEEPLAQALMRRAHLP
jgi:uncharacterized protein (DUF58 family)